MNLVQEIRTIILQYHTYKTKDLILTRQHKGLSPVMPQHSPLELFCLKCMEAWNGQWLLPHGPYLRLNKSTLWESGRPWFACGCASAGTCTCMADHSKCQNVVADLLSRAMSPASMVCNGVHVLKTRVLCMAHEGNLGIVKVKQRCRDTAWWKNIDRDIESLVKDCTACLMSGKSARHQ